MQRVGCKLMKLELRLQRDLNVWTLFYCQHKVLPSSVLQKYIDNSNIYDRIEGEAGPELEQKEEKNL